MATTQLICSNHASATRPMLERIPDLEGLTDQQAAFRVNWTWYRAEHLFVAGDILIIDKSLAGYRGDTVVNDYRIGVEAHDYRGHYDNHDGVVIEVRRATSAISRSSERMNLPPIKSLGEIFQRIDSQAPRPYEGYGIQRITSPDLLATRGIRAHQLTIAGGMGDVYFPGTLFVRNLLVEAGTNLIVSRDLESMEEIMVHGSLTVGGHVTCDDRLNVRGDLDVRGYVHCGRMLVGGDVLVRLGVKAKEDVAIGRSIRADDIDCRKLFVGGNSEGTMCVKQASIGGSLNSCIAWIQGDLVVGGNLRCEDDLEVDGDVIVSGTIWSKKNLMAGDTRELRCAKRIRGYVKRGRLIETSTRPHGSRVRTRA